MHKSRFARILALFMLFSMVLQAAGAAQETVPPPPAEGTLNVLFLSDSGTPIYGCATVTDSNGGVSTLCADDGSGMVTFTGLPLGAATVVNSATADGYYQAEAQYPVILENAVPTVTLYSTPVPAPPEVVPEELPAEEPVVDESTDTSSDESTDTSTEDATTDTSEASTDESTDTASDESTDTSMVQSRGISIMATPGSPSVTCAPLGDGISRVGLIIPVTDGPLDIDPDVQYYTTDRFGNEAGPVSFGTMTWNAQNNRYEAIIADYGHAEIDWEFDLHLGAGWQQINGGGCAYFSPLDLGISTMAKDMAGGDLPDPSQIPSGTPFGDTAWFEGTDAAYKHELAGQTVYYQLYKNDTSCLGDPIEVFPVIVDADGNIPPSPFFTPALEGGDGIYDWLVYYPGDYNAETRKGNFLPATSDCGWETVIVGQNDTAISTTMKKADGATITNNSTVPLGTTVYDTTQLSAVSPTAGGTVTYTLYKGPDCGSLTLVEAFDPVTVSGGLVPDSPTYTPTEIGTYHWVVEYSGDPNNVGKTSPCGAETFSVGKAKPTITTAMFQEGGAPIDQGTSVDLGTKVYDTTTITGGAHGDLTGTITYTLHRGATCGDGVVGSVTLDIVDGVLPASNAAGDLFTADAVGTYNWVVTYNGDDFNDIATSNCGFETFTVEKNTTTISTQPQLVTDGPTYTDILMDGVVSEPADVRDTATLEGQTATADGTVTYVLYEGNCGNLTEVETFGPYNVDAGVVPPSGVAEGLEPGQYNWVATYSGDAGNFGSESPCGEEQFFVTAEGSGGYVHTQVFTDAGAEVPNRGHVPLGASVIDTAQFYGSIVNEGGPAAVAGEIVYTLYSGEGCAPGPVVNSWTYTVTADAAVPAIPADEAQRLEAAGTYNFQAVFTPEGGSPIASPCGTETLIVDPITPTITTTMYGADNAVIENGTRVVRPTSVADGVTFDYGFDDAYMTGLPLPNGTLEYRLHNTANCSGIPVFTDTTKTVTNGVAQNSDPAALSETDFGNYNWVVVFTSTDPNYGNATSNCLEPFFLDAQPTMTTAMFKSVDGTESDLDNGGTVTVGDSVRDTATLHGATSTASGTVTFTLHQGLNCTGVEMFKDITTVTDGVVEPTDWYQIQLFGNYSWKAVYSGDNTTGGFNNSVTHCENETFIANEALDDPTMETVMRNGDTVIPHQTFLFGPASVTDQAIFTNLSTDITGTVTYTLYKGFGNDCANLTEIDSWEVGVANGIAERSGAYSIDEAAFGGDVYSWSATFVSDDGSITVESGCDAEQFRIYGPLALHGVDVTCTYNESDKTMSFDLELNPRPLADDAGSVTSTIEMTAYNLDLSPANPIPAFNNVWELSFDHEPWRQVTGNVTWSTGETASFIVRCNQNPFKPELTTAMFPAGSDVELANDEIVTPGSAVYDTTQVVAGTSTVILTGTLTYQLFSDADCSVQVGASQVKTLDKTPIGSLPASDPITVNDPGTYYWIVTYAPPANDTYPDNSTVSTTCGQEYFNVSAFDTALTTLIVTENGSSTAAATGEDVHDTATLTHTPAVTTTKVPTGTVTYYAFEGTGAEVCADPATAVFTSGPHDLNDDGTFPPSNTTQFLETGAYEWQAVYSGDDNFNGSTSDCGDEPLQITAPTLTIAKTADQSPVNAGDPLGFTVTVTNPGPGTATDVELTDNLETFAGVTWSVDAENSDDSCALNGSTVTCGPDTLAAGETLSVHITGTTSGETCGLVTNTASFTSGNSNDGDSNEASVTVNCPSVTIAKTAEAGTINASDRAVFHLAITNGGPGTATDVLVTDELPGGIVWTLDSTEYADDCAIDDDGVLTCTFDEMAPETAHTITVSAPTTTETCGQLENSASVGASNQVEDDDSGATISVNCSDIDLQKVADDDEVSAGDQIGFTITLTNTGEGDALDTVITDTLPTNAGLDWTIENTNPENSDCKIEDGVLTCDFGTVGNGDSVSVHIVSPTTAESCDVIDNSAVATFREGNNEDANASDQVTVLCPDVQVVKTATNAAISATEAIGFSITVSNVGQGDADGVTLTDTLPADFDWTMNPDVDGCTIEDGVLECDFGTMASQAAITVTLTAPTTAQQCAIVNNIASVTADNEAETSLTNNEDSASVTIECANVELEKTTSTGTISAGEDINFTITLTNDGPGKAFNATLTDTLPTDAGLDWTIDPANDDCDIDDDGVLDCNFGTLEMGATASVTLVSPTTADTCGDIVNAASANFSNHVDLEDDATVTVLCPDLEVEKTADTGVVSAGEDIGFSITLTNTGEGDATDVTLTDTLPAGFDWSMDPDVDGCEIGDDGVLTCDFGTMAPDASHTIHLTASTSGEQCDLVENTASASATNEAEDALENNEDDSSVRINCPDVSILKTAENGTVNASEDIVFNLEVRNIGNGTAFDVEVSDQLPAGLDWTIDPANDDCAIDEDGLLTCELGTMAPQDVITITVRAATSYETCGTYDNTAEVTASNEATTTQQNNSSTASASVNCSDIDLQKVADNDEVSAGDQIGFTITMTNDGEGDAFEAVLTDVLPTNAGLDWTIDPANDACAITDGTLECDFDTVASGDTVSVHISSPTTAETCGVINNTATVTFRTTNTEEVESSDQVTVHCPDVQVVKTAGNANVSAGEDISFSITVSNIGAGVAANVTMTDTLPADFDWTMNPDVDSCTIEDGVLECDFGTLAPQAAITVTLTAPTTAQQCGIVNNTASVGADNEADTALDNNEDDASVTINCPDLAVEKTADSGVVSAGEDIGFSITLTNIGAGDAFNATLTDTLPAGFDWSMDPSVDNCAIEDGVLTCDFGTMAPQAAITVHLTASTTGEQCGLVENTAEAAADNEAETALGNNEDSDSITVNCPDLAVEKIADAGVVSAGEDIGFSLTVTNNGEGKAFEAVLIDTLPADAGLNWTIDPEVEGCSIDEGVLTCDFGTMETGASISIHITSPTNAQTCGMVTNTSTVTAGNESDSTLDNNEDSDSITVNCPDVSVLKTAESGTVNASEDVVFNLEVRNIGSGTAFDVVVTDQLPAGLDWAIEPANDDCTIDEDGLLTCDLGTMAPQDVITITVRAATSYETCGTYTNTASVDASNEAESTKTNNSSTASASVNCSDIDLQKIADDDTVSAGDQIGFTITMTNTGEGDAFEAVLTDVLPTNAGLDWSIDPTNDACAITDGTLECDFGTVATGETVSVHVVSPTTAQTCGVVDNTAEVTFTNADGTEASDQVTVHCPDVQVVKTAGNANVSAGEDISFSITVSNIGQGDADGVTLTDTLPTGFDWTMNPDVDGCTIEDGVLECDFGTMASQAAITITLTAPTTAQQCGVVENTASVSADNEADTALTNNESGDSVRIDCPDLEVEKTTNNGTVSAGEDISFTITVTNTGMGDAFDVTLTDTLPTDAGLDWTIAPENDACDITEGELNCDFGTLEMGATASVTVVSPTTASICGEITNTASSTAGNEADSALENNEDSTSVTVLCPDLSVEKTAVTGVVSAGEDIGFSITLTNIGAGDATDVTLTDTLPAGFDWSMDPAVDDCAIEDGVLTCDFGTMAPQAAITVTLTAPTTDQQCGMVENAAEANAGNEADSALENNEDSDKITINCPEVDLQKVADDNTVQAGNDIGFSIEVSNTGDGNASNTVVTDKLPAADGLAWVIDGGTGAEDCAIEDGVLTCDFGTVVAGETVGVHITSTTTEASCGVIPNTATATFGNADADESMAEVTVNCPDVTPEPTDPATPEPTDPATPAPTNPVTPTPTGEDLPPVHKLPTTGDGFGPGSGIGMSVLIVSMLAVVAALLSVIIRRDEMKKH